MAPAPTTAIFMLSSVTNDADAATVAARCRLDSPVARPTQPAAPRSGRGVHPRVPRSVEIDLVHAGALAVREVDQDAAQTTDPARYVPASRPPMHDRAITI